MDDGKEKQRCALKYSSLNFTDAQYEEALKRVDSPSNVNQLLVALIDISSHEDSSTKQSLSVDYNILPGKTIQQDRESSSSCYSSILSFSSSNQSSESLQQPITLRKIYIDGPNVARTHGRDKIFSWIGIKLCVDWFIERNHHVKVFVPADDCNCENSTVLNYLDDLEALVKTPTGCNDDLFVIEAAKHNNGVIVSNDQYRDEIRLNNELNKFVHSNRLPYVFVEDLFIPAKDPRGRFGPSLDEFLKDIPENSNHLKLNRAKSHQKYQRSGTPSKLTQHPISANRSFSLPPKQTTNSMVDSGNQNSSSSKQHYHQIIHDNNQRQQLRRTVPVSRKPVQIPKRATFRQ